jgi:hypothetical protein
MSEVGTSLFLMPPSGLIQAVALLTYIGEVRGWDTDYLH